MRGLKIAVVRAPFGDRTGNSSPRSFTEGPGQAAAERRGLFGHGPIVLGIWADDAWHTAPALLVVGLLLGVATAASSVVVQIRKYL